MPHLECLFTISTTHDVIWDIKWHPSKEYLASCGSNKKIFIWAKQKEISHSKELEEWTCRWCLDEGHSRTIRRIAWSPANLIASASFDSTIAIWKMEQDEENLSKSFKCILNLEGHENEVKGLSFSNSGKYLATCSRDKSVWIWSVKVKAPDSPCSNDEGEVPFLIDDDDDDEVECECILNTHEGDVKQVAWKPGSEEDFLVSCSYDNSVHYYHSTEGGNDWECYYKTALHASIVWDLSFNLDGSMLASCCQDGSVKVSSFPFPRHQNNESKSVSFCLSHNSSECGSESLYCIDWNYPLNKIATAGALNQIYVYDAVITNNVLPLELTQHNAHDKEINTLAWKPNHSDGILASAGDDGKIKVWRYLPKD